MMAYFSIMEHYFNLTASPHVYNVVKQRAKLLFGTAAPAAAEKKRVGLSRPPACLAKPCNGIQQVRYPREILDLYTKG